MKYDDLNDVEKLKYHRLKNQCKKIKLKKYDCVMCKDFDEAARLRTEEKKY